MSIANLLTSDKQFTNLPQITSEKVILRGGLGNGELTTNSTGTEAYFNGVALATGTSSWVGTATTDLDMAGFDIKNCDTLETNEIALRDGGGIGVIKYSNAEPQIELGTDTIVFGSFTADGVKVSDPTFANQEATLEYDSTSAVLSSDKAFASAIALTAPVLELIDGVATGALTYNATNDVIETSNTTGLSAPSVRASNSLLLGEVADFAQVAYDGTSVIVNKPLDVTGAIESTGTITGTAITGTSLSAGAGAITGASLSVGAGSITCGTINYSSLNPPIASSWVGTATTNLDMKTFNITSSTADVNIVASAGQSIIENAPVNIKLQNAGVDKLIVSSAGLSALAPLAMNTNNISGAGTVSASIVTADDVRAGEVDLIDTGNNAISLQKKAGITYPVYGAGIGSNPTVAIIDDTNNPTFLTFNGATKELTVSAKDVLGNPKELSAVGLSSAFGEYIPLAGTEVGQPITGAVVFDNTANIQCQDIQTGLISALPTVDFISIEDPVQTRVLGVRSEDGTAPARILMALSESAVAPDILQMSYNPAGADALEVNKEIIANGVNLNEAIAFKDANEFFVSSNGSDTTGNGSANAPYATIQKAITEAETTAGDNRVVNIMAGVYSENLTISKGSIILTGNIQSNRAIEGVAVNGKITVNITDVDNLNNNQIILTGFLLSGQIEDVSTKQHTLIVSGMRIEADSALGGQAIYVHPTSADQRTFVTQCVISQEATMLATDALVDVSVGRLQLETCELTVRTLSPCINIGGSAVLIRIYETTLESGSTSGSATALITISSTTTTAHNIAQNTFVIASAVAKADTPAIRATSAVSQTLVLGQNFFSIAGTSTSTNVVKYSTAPTVVCVVANNRALVGSASAIQAGATVVPLTFVGETFISAVSAGTGIGVSTTNGVATVSNTGVTAVTAGSGISTTAGTGSITLANTGVLELTAGTNVTITGTKSNYTISATAGAGGVSDINGETGSVDIVAGTGIGLAVSAGQITISNTQAVDGVQSVSAGSGISLTGTATDPVVNNSGVLTVNSASGALTVSAGTGIGVSTVGSTITISNTQAVDGVQSVSAGSGITVGGTATDPIISNSGLISASAGTGISVSAGAGVGEVVISATGIQAVSAGTGLSSTGGSSPTLSITDTAVSAGSYTVANITVNQQGQITSASNGTVIAEIQAGDGITVGAGTNPNSALITNNGVRTLTAGDSSITVGGTSNAKTVALPNQVATTGVFAYPSMTVDGKGIITAIASQTPVVSVNSASGALTVSAGTGIGVSTVGSTITISNTQAVDGVQTVTAGDGIVITGTASDPIIAISAVGTATFNDIQAVNVNTSGFVKSGGDMLSSGAGSRIGFSAGTGQQNYSLLNEYTATGVTRQKYSDAGTAVPATKAVIFDEINYAPSSPCLPSGFQSGGAGGTLANGGTLATATKTLVAVQTIPLTSTTFPYINTAKYFGLLGNLSLRVSGTQALSWGVEYKKNAGAQIPMTGALYYSNTSFLTVPVNGITYTGIGGDTFVSGDTVTIYVYATNTGIPMTLTTAPAIMSAVYSALAV
jgi:hypothetical protein